MGRDCGLLVLGKPLGERIVIGRLRKRADGVTEALSQTEVCSLTSLQREQREVSLCLHQGGGSVRAGIPCREEVCSS